MLFRSMGMIQNNHIAIFSVRLIVAVPLDTISDVHLHRLLDNVFQSMVLLIGLVDLVAQRSTERIKKDLSVRLISLMWCLTYLL